MMGPGISTRNNSQRSRSLGGSVNKGDRRWSFQRDGVLFGCEISIHNILKDLQLGREAMIELRQRLMSNHRDRDEKTTTTGSFSRGPITLDPNRVQGTNTNALIVEIMQNLLLNLTLIKEMMELNLRILEPLERIAGCSGDGKEDQLFFGSALPNQFYSSSKSRKTGGKKRTRVRLMKLRLLEFLHLKKGSTRSCRHSSRK